MVARYERLGALERGSVKKALLSVLAAARFGAPDG